jgi:hypothetical protein
VMDSCYNIHMNNHYIYIWKEQGVAGSGLPFYVGQGTHESDRNEKYRRSIQTHYTNNKVYSFGQHKANKLARLGTPHVIEILYDDLTQDEANKLEKTLISRLGRRLDNTGILCNISEGADFKPHSNSEIYRKWLKARRARTEEIMNDPILYDKWYNALVEANGQKIEYNGIVYSSKVALAKHLGIGYECLNSRLRDGVKLDADVKERKKEFEFEGVIYSSRKELCRVLGLSISTYKYRIANNIPLDRKLNEGKGKYDRV